MIADKFTITDFEGDCYRLTEDGISSEAEHGYYDNLDLIRGSASSIRTLVEMVRDRDQTFEGGPYWYEDGYMYITGLVDGYDFAPLGPSEIPEWINTSGGVYYVVGRLTIHNNYEDRQINDQDARSGGVPFKSFEGFPDPFTHSWEGIGREDVTYEIRDESSVMYLVDDLTGGTSEPRRLGRPFSLGCDYDIDPLLYSASSLAKVFEYILSLEEFMEDLDVRFMGRGRLLFTGEVDYPAGTGEGRKYLFNIWVRIVKHVPGGPNNGIPITMGDVMEAGIDVR